MAFGGFLKQSTAVDVLIGPFLDSTDGYTPETGLSIDVELSKNGQALANKNDADAPVHDSAGSIDGYYNCELDATDTNTVGQLTVVCYAAGALPCRHEYQVVEEAIYTALFDTSADIATEIESNTDTAYSDTLVKIKSNTDVIISDVTLIDVEIESGISDLLDKIYSDTKIAVSDGIVTDTVADKVYSDTTTLTSNIAVIETQADSHITVLINEIESNTDTTVSDLNLKIESDTDVVVSDIAETGVSIPAAISQMIADIYSNTNVIEAQADSHQLILVSDIDEVSAGGVSAAISQMIADIHSNIIVLDAQTDSDTTVLKSKIESDTDVVVSDIKSDLVADISDLQYDADDILSNTVVLEVQADSHMTILKSDIAYVETAISEVAFSDVIFDISNFKTKMNSTMNSVISDILFTQDLMRVQTHYIDLDK